MRLLARALGLAASLLVGSIGWASEEVPQLRFDPFKSPELELSATDGRERASLGVTRAFAPELRATLIGENTSMVNVDGKLLSPGDEIEGYTLITIEERQAVFERGGQRSILTLDDNNGRRD